MWWLGGCCAGVDAALSDALLTLLPPLPSWLLLLLLSPAGANAAEDFPSPAAATRVVAPVSTTLLELDSSKCVDTAGATIESATAAALASSSVAFFFRC
jgi:hypothetical protein